MNIDEILKTMKILYVEDEDEAREELVDVFKRRVGKVMAGENGRRGLELYEDLAPDIVVADLYMPEMDGLEMIRQIKARKPDQAVIVISAVEDVDTILGAIDVGVDKYILKPVNMQKLLDVLAEQAELIHSRRQRKSAVLPENKKRVEDEIRREFASLLKTITGKGPRDVSVFMTDEQIELVAAEVLTVMEKNLLDNNQNIAIIKHNRELFFSVKEEEICRLISRISGRDVSLKEVLINVEKDKNKLIFTIHQSG